MPREELTPEEMAERERAAEEAQRILDQGDKLEDHYKKLGKRVTERASGLVVVTEPDNDGPYG